MGKYLHKSPAHRNRDRNIPSFFNNELMQQFEVYFYQPFSFVKGIDREINSSGTITCDRPVAVRTSIHFMCTKISAELSLPHFASPHPQKAK